MTITTIQQSILIPFEVLISLYQEGYIHRDLLAHSLPIEVIREHCPEVLSKPCDTHAIAKLLSSQDSSVNH